MSKKLLLRCLAKSLLKNAVKSLVNQVPFGGTLYDVAVDTWDEYRKGRLALGLAANSAGDASLRQEVEELARELPADVQREAEEAVRQVAAGEPAEVQAALTAYLSQVPAAVRQSLRRSDDPTGTTVPANLPLRRPEDLLRFLPERMPRFKAGDRPIPGVDRELVELLGVGGFGEVWTARNPHKPTAPLVALKFCLDEQSAKALRNEAALLERLERHGLHPGIVALKETYLHADPPCLEYEYVVGGDLTALIGEWHADGRRPRPEQVARLMLQLAEIVAFTHELKPAVVHRDLKPANILLERSKKGRVRPKVADFGIGGLAARQALRGSPRPVTSQKDMTKALRGAHTPLYASPQQVRPDSVPDPRDDVYALGIIWYQMLTGDLTTGAPTGDAWKQELARGGVPRAQVELMRSCFEATAGARPLHAGELAARLKRLIEPRVRLKPLPWVAAAGTLATVVAVVLLALAWSGAGDVVAAVKKEAGIELVSIPKGSFYMGSPDGDKDAFGDEKPQHKVTISNPFYLGKYKVTVGQFKRFIAANPTFQTEAEKNDDKWTWKKPGFLDKSFDQTDEHPVVCVSWNDAKAYCEWLDGLLGGQGKVRLPYEAEWEYSCRAVTEAKLPTTKFYFGNDDADLEKYAWYGLKGGDGTKPCGQKEPNKFGLYDMHGLAWEWCWDGKREYPKDDGVLTDPKGPTTAGASRVFRGGSWDDVPRGCRAARRGVFAPSFRYDYIGFRVFVSR